MSTDSEVRAEVFDGEVVLMPGRYMATGRIPLLPPFNANWIEAGQRFDILDRINGDDMVLVRFEGLRVWKHESHFAGGKVTWIGALKLFEGARHIGRIYDQDIPEERVPLDDLPAFARAMGVEVGYA